MPNEAVIAGHQNGLSDIATQQYMKMAYISIFQKQEISPKEPCKYGVCR